VNANEAKIILLLYRPGTADADDPQIAEALALAKSNSKLALWFEQHCARQKALRAKFREVAAPAGLMEQIISEQAAQKKMTARQKDRVVAALAVAVIVVSLLFSVQFWLTHFHRNDISFAHFQNQMAYATTSGYGMDFTTNDLPQIRAYLARNGAPSDYVLPAPLEKTTVAGCAIENWYGKKVSMICFRTGKRLPPNQQSDLWLFVVDRKAVKHAPAAGPRQFAPVGPLFTAAWTQDGKLYLLGTEGDEQTIKQYL
jgi:hypothetical protein